MTTGPAVLAALAEGPATAPELAARLDGHPTTVARCCEQLARAGRLRRLPGGAYARVGAPGPQAAD